MSLSPGRRPSYRWLGIALLVAAGVYGWYVLGQYGRLNSLNQRQLSNAAAELERAIETAQETVFQFFRKRSDWAASRTGTEPRVCDFDRSQPYVDLAACAGAVADERVPGAAEEIRRWPDLRARLVASPTLGIEATGASGQSVQLQFRTDRLLQELAFPDAFELILVVNGDGRVLYQDAPGERRWVRYLRLDERRLYAARPLELQIWNVKEALGADDATWKRLLSGSSRTGLQLAGTGYQIYLQPLALDVENGLIVAAVVPKMSVLRDALALDTGLLGVLVFLLLVITLGYPFIKLAFLGTHERFRLRDINLLYMSTGALLVLFSCALFAADGLVRWRAVASAGLRALASDFEARISQELGAIRDQMVEYDRRVEAQPVADCLAVPVETAWFSDAAWREGRPDAMLTLPWPTQRVHLRQVAWIDAGGRQLWKITAERVPGRVAVDQRAYFRAVRDGDLFGIGDQGPPVFFAPDRSITNGKFYTFVSSATGASLATPGGGRAVCRGNGDEGAVVTAATAHLLSLDAQPLPAGYSFALVNRTGRTLYHSDHRLSLRENLFDELSAGDRARAMAYAGQAGHLSGRYRERPHEIYLRPLALSRAGEGTSAGYVLAVLRDSSVERTLVGHVLVKGLVGPMLLLFGIFIAGLWSIALAARRVNAHWSAWLWPYGGLERVYRRQALCFLLVLGVSIAFCVVTESVVIFMATPVIAAALGIGLYVQGARARGARRRLAAPAWHAAALTLVLVCMVMAPSTALFRLALSREFAKVVSTERAWIAAQRADTLRAADVEAAADYSPSRRSELLEIRRQYFACVPAPFGEKLPMPARETLDAEMCQPDGGGAGGATGAIRPVGLDALTLNALQWWLDDVLPIENDIVSRQRFETTAFTYTPGGARLGWIRASGVAFAGTALILGLLVWWVRWNATRLFLADEENAPGDPPAPPFDATWEALSPDERMVLLQVMRERLANPHQRPIVTRLLRKGLLRLDPDLQPSSPPLEEFLQAKERELQQPLYEWERVDVEHSWRYVRLVLVASVTGLAAFLILTQPGLQSSLLGIATGLTGVLAVGLKLRDAIASWLSHRGGT